MKNPWKQLSRKTIYTGFLGHKVHIDKVLGPSGKESEYFVVEVKDDATILAITNENKVVMEKIWRYPINKESFEVPAGGLEEGETALEAGKRELTEETGYFGGEWIFLGSHYMNNGFSNSRSNMFLARNVVAPLLGSGRDENSDENEKIEVELVDFEELKQMVMDGKIDDSRTELAVLLASRYL
jgi:ADP-ribose pyrophosphatase